MQTNIIQKERTSENKIFVLMKANHSTLRFQRKYHEIRYLDKKNSIARLLR